MTQYNLKNRETGETVSWNMTEMLEEINRDRTDQWTPYDKGDWLEGLGMTDYELIT